MNSGFRPLPTTIPALERGRIMVRRGEFKDLSAAMKHLASLRKKKPPASSDLPSASANVSTFQQLPTGNRRLPYNDD